MKRLDHWNSMDIADHARRQPDDPGPTGMDGESMFGPGEDRASKADPPAHYYLARKRMDDLAASSRRAHHLLTACLIALLLVTVTFALAYAGQPVARLAHDTARGEYCGAC